jgi:hypothetical protein
MLNQETIHVIYFYIYLKESILNYFIIADQSATDISLPSRYT